MVAFIMNTDTRTPLRKAVDRLIAEGKIKQDKDLQEIFGLSKSTISAYLNNPRPGKRFIIEFEKKFGISLKEFGESSGNGEYYLPTKELDEERAMIHLLVLEVAKLKAVSLGVDPALIVAEFYRSARTGAVRMEKEREGKA